MAQCNKAQLRTSINDVCKLGLQQQVHNSLVCSKGY